MLVMNRETGELMPEAVARIEFRREYDGGDPTNCIEFEEYFEEYPEEVIEVYYLSADDYGQPRGTVSRLKMTRGEYDWYKTNRRGVYLFDDYAAAIARAMD